MGPLESHLRDFGMSGGIDAAFDEPPARRVDMDKPVASSGGSSPGYYEVTVVNKKGERLTCDTGDIIRALVSNDFNLGNIVKASRRISEAMQGRGKKGTSIEYDLNKIIYFTEDLKNYVRNR